MDQRLLAAEKLGTQLEMRMERLEKTVKKLKLWVKIKDAKPKEIGPFVIPERKDERDDLPLSKRNLVKQVQVGHFFNSKFWVYFSLQKLSWF